MPRIRVFDLVYDFGRLNAYVRMIENDLKRPRARGPIRQGMERAADRYVKYLKRRFRAGGGKTWPHLDPLWVERKSKWKGLKGSPSWKLRMGGQLLDGIEYNMIPSGFEVGYVGKQSRKLHKIAGVWAYNKRDGWHMRDKQKRRTVRTIARAHQTGERHLPVRRIVVMPPVGVRKQIIEFVRQGFRAGAVQANKRARR